MNANGEAGRPSSRPAILPADKRALFILNPQAGRGRARRLFRSLPGTARNLGWDVEIRQTERAGDEVGLAAEGQQQGWPVLIAVGGDGTVHGVANGLLRDGPTDTVLAHVPIGTGNDFAKMVGLDRAGHPERNLKLVLQGYVSRLDVGCALDEYFVNGLGIGFGAEVARNLQDFKRLRGFPLYLASVYRTFFSFEAPRLDVRSEEHSETGVILMTEIAIGKTAGGGFKLTPAADPRDGLLDVCLIRDVGVLTFLRYIPRVLRGTHTSLAPVTVFQTRQVEVTSPPGSRVVHLDGEVRRPEKITIVARIEPAALPTLCAR
ncbi:MAG: diacylglycerol kinase family lipid kinase [Gemmatimonadota bacterium]|nr:MAG: diacylglycerol kinase family lipid kinase [Gemmatimonadota bacterium]